MGLSSSKQKSTNDPSKFAAPYITQGANNLQSTFGAIQPQANAIGSQIASHLPQLEQDAFTPSAGYNAAAGYNADVLNGKYLDAGNPYLAAQIAATNSDVTNGVQSAFGAAGRTGSGANQYALTKGLANNETALRYADYGSERDRMGQAAALEPTLDASRYNGLGAYLTAANAAIGIPTGVASGYGSSLGSLLGQYNTQTQKTSQGVGTVLGSVLGSGLAGWASGGFKGV